MNNEQIKLKCEWMNWTEHTIVQPKSRYDKIKMMTNGAYNGPNILFFGSFASFEN